MNITLKWSGIEQFQRELARIRGVASDMTTTHRHIGNIIQNSIEQSFEDEKSPFGEVWTPLKAGRANHKILTDTGTLSSSFGVNANANSVEVGTNLVYAPIHQFGGQAGRDRSVTIDARPYLPVDDNGLQSDVEEEILEYLRGRLSLD